MAAMERQTTKTSNVLSEPLAAVLAHLCRKLGPLIKTRAVKLTYLVDVVANRDLGRPITGGSHQTWDYGVVTAEVYRAITRNQVGPLFKVDPHEFSESGFQLRLVGDPPPLEESEREVVDEVAERFGRWSAEDLGMLTKAMNTHLGPDAWGKNNRASIGEDASFRLSEGRLRLHRQLSDLDLEDRSKWGEPIRDPKAFAKSVFKT